jgi:prepilin signal peptidase PulO-like enzyme (type II secretory pathway)
VVEVAIVLGGVVGVAAVLWSLHTATVIRISLSSEPFRQASYVRVSTLVVGAIVGGITGWRLHQSNPVVDRSLLVVVSLLLLAQGPLDLLTRRLSRPVTVGGFVAAVGIVAMDAFSSSAPSHALFTMLMCIAVVAGFGVLHRLSATSLGLGDVFLVAPLSLAVSHVSPQNTLVWLLVASVSGAIHGALILMTRRSHRIPFGPHLVVAAWLVLVLSV